MVARDPGRFYFCFPGPSPRDPRFPQGHVFPERCGELSHAPILRFFLIYRNNNSRTRPWKTVHI